MFFRQASRTAGVRTGILTMAAFAALISRAGAGGNAAWGGTPAAVPGTISAQNFDTGGPGVSYFDTTPGNSGGAYRQTDVDIENSSEGAYDVGWTAPSEWLNYTVSVASAGSYIAQLRVASPSGGSLHIGFNTASNVWVSVSVPATGAWQSWTTVSVPVTLGAGVQQMTVLFDTGGLNLEYVNVVSGSGGGGGGGGGGNSPAWGGTPAAVPGTISAQNFDTGGPGVSYLDTTPGNTGGAYRQTDVDIENSSEGAYDIGWIASGEWVNYTVNVASAGSYIAQLRVASPSGGSLHIGFNAASNVWASVSVPATGAWQTWTTVSVPVTLGAGVQQMTLAFDTSGFNVEYVNVVTGSGTGGGGGGTGGGGTPGGGGGSGATITAVTWNVEVNDASAAHAQTVIDYMMNLSPQPQVVIIEEAHQSQYNTYINELSSRTGQYWTGVMQTHCPLGAWNGSYCTGSEDEGVAVFSSLPVVDSGKNYLPYADAYHSARAAVRLAVNVNGVVTQVFGTHLQVGDATARDNSMTVLKNWSSGYSAPQLVGGDFNADMDQIDTTAGMLPNFTDSWATVGSGSGFTASTPSPTMKLDYLFSDSSGRAKASWTYVVTSTGTVSDHYPVTTQFTVQ